MMAGANEAKSDGIQGVWGKKRGEKPLLLALHQWQMVSLFLPQRDAFGEALCLQLCCSTPGNVGIYRHSASRS